MRDDFNQRTRETIAKRAGYLCSNPECRCSTIGAAPSHDGFVNVGVAAHITAASPDGPRYDPSLSREERRNQSNGLWACQTHAKLIDSDREHFTVKILRRWKGAAEERSFRAILSLQGADQRIVPAAPDTAVHELIALPGLTTQDNLESVTLRLIGAAQSDLAAFKRMPGWPRHAITLNLKVTEGDSVRAFNVSALATALETFNETVVVAPPGTGKTTTLLQLVEALLSHRKMVAVFVPLSEWSSQPDSFFQSIVRRHAFVGVRQEHVMLLAHYGRLVLVMDGWNELDAASRIRAFHGIAALQREFPDLGIVVSSRRQALDVPISGPVVEIDTLTESQQLEVARALRGPQGEAILDHAWRTPGVSELVAIPLYLTALLTHAQGAVLPTTKEEVLHLFVTQHEQATDQAEALRGVLFGFHPEMLRALAVEATCAENTTISDGRARSVVKQVEDQLSAEGQIRDAPQPTAVLDVLVSKHVLVRSGAETGGISFQHQQFQEWYASFEVEALMRAAEAGDREARQKLRADLLNVPAWEEPILFACERMSHTNRIGSQAVAASVLEAIGIDPMLAAEMIYRSSIDVWDQIKEKIIAFVGRWHTNGKVDRAVYFMISTGRSEFANQLWPLISDADSQIYLAALRAGRRFRPSILGDDAQARIAQLPEELREHVVSEIAIQSGMDGIEMAASLAQADVSPKVKASVIQSLQFRHADRFVAEVLKTAPDKVWHLLVRQGYAEEITDPDSAARLRHERQSLIESETDPLSRLRMLLDAARSGVPFGLEVGTLIKDAAFPIKDQQAGWLIEEARRLYPSDVTTAFLHRLESGQEIPFQAEDLLQASGIVVDEGPLVDLVMQPDGAEKVVEAAVSIVGPRTIGKLIDMLVEIDQNLRADERADEHTRKQHQRLARLIDKTGQPSFIQALLYRSSTSAPEEISLLADLFARHGKGHDHPPQQFDSTQHELVVDAVGRWAEILLSSPSVSRSQLAEVARAIERLAAPQLVPLLQRMLAEDLARWKHARDESAIARNKGIPINPDTYTSWTLQYRRAFAAIGDGAVVELMTTYLPDAGLCGFGVDAAYVLKTISDREENFPKDKRFTSWPDFSEVRAKRIKRQNPSMERPSSDLANAIIVVVNDLLKPDAGKDAHRHALQLAQIAFSMPYGNRTEVIDALLRLPRPLVDKQGLLAVLVLAGEIIRADMVLAGIRTLLDQAKTKSWLLDENRGELEGWLDLLPFSDRPSATLDALRLLEPNLRQPWRLRRLLLSLGYSPSEEAERLLGLLPREDTRFLTEHYWLTALEARETVSSARLLLDLICDGTLAGGNTWPLSRKLAGAMRTHTDFRIEVYHRYERMPPGPGKTTLEHTIAEVADAEGVLVLVRSHAVQNKPFDGTLHSAIRHAAMGERPSANWAGANEVYSVPIPDLRKRLFAMVRDDATESRLAAACLTAIDELRDDYGPAESEPRHPDIDSGQAWPLAARDL